MVDALVVGATASASVKVQNKVMQNQNSLPTHRSEFKVYQSARALLCLALFLGVGGMIQAADVTTAAQQAAGANWNAPAIWSDGLAPSAGKTYRLIAGGNPSRLRNPVLTAGQTTTFAGDSLTIDAGQEIRWKGPGTIVNLPGVGGNPGLIVNGGLLNTGDDNYNVLIQGKVQFLGNSTIDNTKLAAEVNRTMTFQADVSGSGSITIQNSFPTIPVDFQSSANTYIGTWVVNSGYLKGSGNNSLGTNSITMAAGTTLEVNYDLKCFGTITLNGNAQMKLHSFVQVQSAVVNGTPIPAGIYTWAQANAAFPANFPAPGSGGIRVGTPIDAIFQDVATSYIAWEAENKVAITNLGTANWAVIADGTASGGSAIQEQGSGADNARVDGTARWNLVFRQAGTYHLYIKYQITPCCGANSYKYPNRFGGDLTQTDAGWRVSSINEGGHGAPYGVIHEREQNQTAVFATFTVAPGDVGNPLVLMFGNREVPGVTIDRIVLSTDPTLADSGDGPFNALINSTGGSQLLAAPTVLSVDSRLNPNGVRITFSGGVDATGLNPANYTLNNGVTVSGAAYAYDAGGSNIVQLTTTALTPNTTYTVTVSNVQNLQGLVMSPNPTNRTFTHYAGLNQPGGLQVNIYNGANTLALVKTAIANCTAPTFTTNTINVAFEYTTSERSAIVDGNTFLQPNTENYGTKVFGMFVAPTSGNYEFALSCDDLGELYLSTDASPANKVLLTSQPAWNGFRGYISGNGNPPPALPLPITLQAGRSYYMEAVVAEGGGGDHVSVAVRKPGDPALTDNQLPIPRSMFSTNYSLGCPPTRFFRTLGPVTQSVAPATQTVQERSNASFFVGIDGIPPYGIQWYSNNVPVPGASNEVYTFPTLRAADGSQFYAIVKNDFSSFTSSIANLTIISDTTPPTAVSAVGGANRMNASVIFSESMTASSATNIANYQITNAAGAVLAITGAIIAPDPSPLAPNGKIVTLTTAAQNPNGQYWVVINNLTDRAGVPNPIAPNSVVSFIATDLDLLAGKVLFRAYNAGGTSVAVDALVNDPLYPNSPDFTQLINGFNTRLANDPANPGRYSGDTRENYGGTMVGHFIPPASGNWTFYTSADDGSRLFVNTNGPSSIGKVQLLNVIPCCGVFAANPTVPVSLIAGQAYYIEALYKEGGGGDFMQVAARLTAGDNSVLVPIPQAQVGFASKLTINQNPTNITVVQNHNASFSVVATLAGAGAGSQTYQWQRSTDTSGSTFTNIPAATTSSYTLFAGLADDQFQFRVVVTSVLATNTTPAATLTVLADNVGPVLVSVASSVFLDSITLTWNEILDPGPVDPANGNYVLTDPGLNEFTFDNYTQTTVGDHSVVTLHLAPANPRLAADTTYTLQIFSQIDIAFNSAGDLETNFHTFPFGGQIVGQLFREEYLGIGGSAIIDITNNAAYLANNPSLFNMMSMFDTGGDHAENYGARISGYIVPTETANYTFRLISDDAGYADLSTDETRANAIRLVSETPGCCADVFSGTRTLQAGHAYFVEAVYKEGTGGDYLRLSWRNDLSIPAYTVIPGANLAYFYSLSITQQPANAIVDPNIIPAQSATFTARGKAGGAAQAVKYQWHKSIDGGTTYNPILGATSSSYSFVPIFGDNGSKYRAEVYLLGGFQTNISDAATLTLLADTTKPFITRASGIRAGNAVKLVFSEALDSGSATEPSNYSLTNSLGDPVPISGAVLGADQKTVTLATPDLGLGSNYIVHAEGVADFGSGNAMVATNIGFQSWLVGVGSLIFDTYLGLSLNPVIEDLTNAPAFPNSPSETTHVSTTDSRQFYPDDSHEGYGGRMAGYLVPPLTANYNFYLRSDDASKLFLSTNNQESNKVELAFETGCCNPYTAHAAGPISLTAGQQYYVEIIYKEGTGGDYVQVAAKLSVDPSDPNGLPTINGAYLASLADPVGASITFTQQPIASALLPLGGTTNLQVGVTTTNDYGDYNRIVYQWQQYTGGSWVNIVGANSSSYATAPMTAGENRQYRCVVYIPGANAASAVASINGPGVLTITPVNSQTNRVSWTGAGILQSAPEITGPWVDTPSQANPQDFDILDPRRFFRLR
jgi:hypothetical protein